MALFRTFTEVENVVNNLTHKNSVRLVTTTNIALNGLNSKHQKAELTYVIGETSYWGKGVATFAVAKMIQIAKTEFDLNKLYAGIASSNINSGKVLKKNGFILEGTRKKHLFYCGEFFDQLDYGLLL